jgi:CRISPR-associated protein Csm1
MEEREELQLGSLLHDIGKLIQRTESVTLTKEDRALESTCCPVYRERYSHTHVLYTQKFFTELWPDLFPLAEILAIFHHRPDTCTNSRLAKMVALADRLSSGERHSQDDDHAQGNPRKARLHCIFSSLHIKSAREEPSYFPLLPLDSSLADLFPEPGATLEAKESYDRLWQKMIEEFKRLDPSNKFSRLYIQVHHLLERFTMFVPSAAYRDRADISLFHHAKATAAIATCLYDLGLEESELDGLLTSLRGTGSSDDFLDREVMWLIGADLSGIQDFIYSVVSKKALKGLRGRSAYLQLLTEAVLSRLLNDFHLSCSNQIYSGGGHFYLLAPYTPGSAKILESSQKYIDQVLVRAHKGQLALCIAWEPLRYRDFLSPERQDSGSLKNDLTSEGGFSTVWNRLGAKLARKKRAKFKSLFSGGDGLGDILGPFPATGIEKACDVCGDPVAGETEQRCGLCASFEKLATLLARAESVSLEVLPTKASSSGPIKSYEDVFDALGVNVRLFRPDEYGQGAYLLNRTDFVSKDPPYLGFRFLARHTPIQAGDVITLEDLAERAAGIKKWGVVRADVDRLGHVFREGLAGSDRSISRVSMLSYLLSLYFSAHVEKLAENPAYGSKLSIVYSGGDDLFALGSWSVLKEFAENVYRDFHAFTDGRLTLSAGVCLAPGTAYPVAQAGKLAGEEELRAKEHGRDRFAVFGEAIRWQDLPELQKIEATLVRLIDEKAPRSLFSVLYGAFEAQEQAKRGEILLFPVWRLLYALRRLVERQRKLSELLMALEQLILRNLWMPEHAVVAVRIAEYLTRQGEKGENYNG